MEKFLLGVALLINSAIVSGSSTGLSPDTGRADVSADLTVTLDGRTPFEWYILDISGIGLTGQEAVTLFGYLNDNLLLFRVDPEQMTVRLRLRLKERPAWTLEEWNNHLKVKALQLSREKE